MYCSAHYFDVAGRYIAYSWYDQGTRILDVSDPANPVQVAYYRPDGGVAWAPYFHRGLIYVADHSRGLEVLRGSGARTAAARWWRRGSPTATASWSCRARRACGPTPSWAGCARCPRREVNRS